MKYDLLIAQVGVQGMCDVVECGNVLVCTFHYIHHYVEVLPVHLSGISSDV